MNNFKNIAIKGATAVFISKLICYMVQIIGTFVLARLLSPKDFGIVAMVTIFSNILIEFGMLQLSEAVIQADTVTEVQKSTLFWLNVLLCGIIAVLFVISSPLLVNYFNEPRLTNIMLVISFSFIISGIGIQHLILIQKSMEFRNYAIILIVSTIINEVISMYFAYMDFGYWSLVSRRVGYTILSSIGAWYFCKWRPMFRFNFKEAWPLIKFGLKSLANYSIGYISRSLDKIMVGKYFNSTELGYYDRAYYFFVLPGNLVTFPLTNLAVSTLSKLRYDMEKFVRYYINASVFLALISFPLGFLLVIVGGDLIFILLGKQWIRTGELIKYLSPSIGFYVVGNTYTWVHFSLGHPDRLVKWTTFSTAITSVLILAGLKFGLEGIAICYASSFVLLFIPSHLYAIVPTGINTKQYIHDLIIIIVISFVSIFPAGYFKSIVINNYSTNVYMVFSITCTVYVFVYCILIMIVFGKTQYRRMLNIYREIIA